MSNLVRLRRHDTGTPWGFRLSGGAENGQPIFVQKITQRSMAHKAGLRPGDVILQICTVPTSGMTVPYAKGEILRAGNDLDFIIQRTVVSSEPPEPPKPVEPRGEVIEDPVWDQGGPVQNPHIQSRSFKILQQQLSE